jgi:hypothetical protein
LETNIATPDDFMKCYFQGDKHFTIGKIDIYKKKEVHLMDFFVEEFKKRHPEVTDVNYSTEVI